MKNYPVLKSVALPIARCFVPIAHCLLFIACCLVPTSSFAQQITFMYGTCRLTPQVPNTLSISGNTALRQVPSDSGYIAFGTGGYKATDSHNHTLHWTTFGATKSDKNGNLEWARVYRDAAADHTFEAPYDGIPTTDGGFIMAGETADSPMDYFWKKNTCIQKVDKNGHKVWAKVYKLSNNDENKALKIREMPDGGYIVMGRTKDVAYSVNGNGGSEINADYSYNTYLLRLDANGNTVWCYYYDAGKYGEEEPKSLDITDDGGFIVGGTTNNDSIVDGFITEPKLSYTKAFMMKVSANGATVEWARRYGAVFKGFPFYGDYFYEVKQTPDGGYIAVGETRATQYTSTGGFEDNSDVWVVKTNASGAIEWQKSYPTMLSLGGLEILSDGYILGNGVSIVKISLAGEHEWSKAYAVSLDNGIGSAFYEADRINVTMDGGYIMRYISSYYSDIIIKTNALGELEKGCFYTVGYPDPVIDERIDTLFTLTPVLVSNSAPVNLIIIEDSITAGVEYCPVVCDTKRTTTTVAPRLVSGLNICANTDASIFVYSNTDSTNYYRYQLDCGDPESGINNYFTSTLGFLHAESIYHNYANPGTYTLTMVVYNSDYSQSDTAYATVNVSPKPIITLLTPEISVCSKDTVTLAARIDNYDYPSYYDLIWTTNLKNQYGFLSGGSSPVVMPDSSVDYYVVNAYGMCNLSDTVTVTIGDSKAEITGNTNVCQGGTTLLKASGGDSYVWSTGAKTPTITVSPAFNQTYWVEAVTADGCRDTGYVYVRVVPTINVEVVADRTAVCTGDQVTLYATGAENYSWNTGANTDTIITTAAEGASTFIVTGTSGSCTDTAAIVITGDAKPVGVISGPTQICQDIEYTLTASGGDSYYWSEGSKSNPEHKISFGNASSEGTYSVKVYKGGCFTTVEHYVSIYKPANTDDTSPDIGGIQADECRVCPGTEVTLRKYFYFPLGGSWLPNNASSPENEGLTYQWSTGQTGAGTNDSIKLTVTKDTVVTLTTTNISGCSVSNSIKIEAKPYFFINTEADSIASCSNSPTTLYLLGEPLEDFTWSNGSKEDTLVYSPPNDTWISITATGNGCTRTDSVYVYAKSNLPEATISGNSPVCNGVSDTYSASGNASITGYRWLADNSTGAVKTFSFAQDSAISVEVTFTGGCADTAQYAVSVTPTPDANIAGDTLVCPGATISLKASGGYTYQWNTGSSTNNISFTTFADTTIKLYAYAGNCADSATVTIQTNQILTATLYVDQDSICEGIPLTLIAGGGDEYTWNTGAEGEQLGIMPAETTTYTVTSTDKVNCSDTEEITITVAPSPTISITACKENNAFTLTVSGGEKYLWNTGDTLPSLSFSLPADSIYKVTVFVDNCADSNTININALPVAFVDAGPDVSVNYGENETLNALGTGSLQWSPAEGLSCVSCQSPVAQPERTTVYYVSLYDTNGCAVTDSVTVYVLLPCGEEIYVPNAFSPNADGSNDRLAIANPWCLKSYTFAIYDRWGETIYEQTKPGEGWDGTYKGKSMDPAVFVYTLNGTLANGEPVNNKGNVTLIK